MLYNWPINLIVPLIKKRNKHGPSSFQNIFIFENFKKLVVKNLQKLMNELIYSYHYNDILQYNFVFLFCSWIWLKTIEIDQVVASDSSSAETEQCSLVEENPSNRTSNLADTKVTVTISHFLALFLIATEVTAPYTACCFSIWQRDRTLAEIFWDPLS